jgi:hypothetical protein
MENKMDVDMAVDAASKHGAVGIKCPQCSKLTNERECFTKSVIHLDYHPCEYREKKFCSTACIKAYMERHRKIEANSNTARIYQWGGAVA